MEIWDGQTAKGRQVFAESIVLFLNPMDPRHKNTKGYKHIIGSFAGIPAPMPGAQMVAPNEIRENAVHQFQSTLRGLVNQWIESGKRDTNEEPWERSFRFTSPNYPESIESILLEFWKRNPPRVLIYGSQQALSTQTVIRQSDWRPLSGEALDRILERARDHAIAHFAQLMDSPSRYRIFRCEACCLYFVKKRMPKKGVAIKAGSYCEQCKHVASKRRVESARDGRRAQMIGWAAEAKESWRLSSPAVQRWKRRNRAGKEIDWIVEQVNESLKADDHDPIKCNWVTRHRRQIETELKRRKGNGD